METVTDLPGDAHHPAAPILSPVLWVEGKLPGPWGSGVLLAVCGRQRDLPGSALGELGQMCCQTLSPRPWGPVLGAAGKSLGVYRAGGLRLDTQPFQLLRPTWKRHSRDILSVWIRDLA